MEFKKEYVHCLVDESLVGKKVFCADSVIDLQNRVEHDNDSFYLTLEAAYGDNEFPFEDEDGAGWKFVYYDPSYNPDDTGLKWEDLKLGDIIRNPDNGREVMVTGIDVAEDTELHIYAGHRWLDDKALSKWEKV